MPGTPGPRSVADIISGPFVPTAKINNAAHNVVDMRTPTPMDFIPHYGFVTDPNTGARLASPGARKWIPLPPQNGAWAAHPVPTGGGRVVHPR